MDIWIEHTTEYIFDEPIDFCMQQIRVTPSSNTLQVVKDWSVKVDGGERTFNYRDFNGNVVNFIEINQLTEKFSIHASGSVKTYEKNGVLGTHSGNCPLWLFKQESRRTKAGSRCRRLARSVKNKDLLESMHELSKKVEASFIYDKTASNVTIGAEEALSLGRGVCQDFTHVFVCAARRLGVPSRYVSGYLLDPENNVREAMHGWPEVYVSSLGWVGFDPVNGICPDERYVRVAIGRDYEDIAPTKGLFLGSREEIMNVALTVSQQ